MVQETLAQHHELSKRLKGKLAPSWLHAVADINEQLKNLIYSRFINQTPIEWFKEYPRYFKAINLRLAKLASGGEARDRVNMLEIKPLWQAYDDRKQKQQKQGVVDGELATYRWMIEELRVSLFAQELKTKVPVSVQRLKKQLERVR
jgi:ATP-dependent helicase HrpA